MENSAVEEKTSKNSVPNSSPTEYDEFASEIVALDGQGVDAEDDSAPIIARVVAKLKTKYPTMSEALLFESARDLYWKWRDAKREEKTGTEEFCTPSEGWD